MVELKDNESVFKKVIRLAQYESEVELGGNPHRTDQARTSYLSEDDFEYIDRVCNLVEIRLQDSNWVTKTLDSLGYNSEPKKKPLAGIRFNDELFKSRRGILESFLHKKYNS